ncbi:hypothetical protein [Mycolicibacterium llatzerense]|uniref:hypothetical protein n=1 Tax=Mycolicibacterium llatzerense TaxID=280871 RepID=UPI0008DD36A2|nr:hypothetical protein [Mycolicibacterium llatzerense]
MRRILLAGIGGLVVAVVTACGAGGAGDAGSVDKNSQAYKAGLESGMHGQAEIAAFGGLNIASGKNEKLSPKDACENSWSVDRDPGFKKQDYMAGCLYGIDHNVNSTNAPGNGPATVKPPFRKGPNGETVPNN